PPLRGAKGAGKPPPLKAISGVPRTERGEVTKGGVELDGQRIDRLPPFEVVRRGIAQVFEGRRVFEHLTTEENLVAGAHIERDRRPGPGGIHRAGHDLPRPRGRSSVPAGRLPPGEPPT